MRNKTDTGTYAISFSGMLPVCEDSLRGQFIFSFLRRDGNGAIAAKKI